MFSVVSKRRMCGIYSSKFVICPNMKGQRYHINLQISINIIPATDVDTGIPEFFHHSRMLWREHLVRICNFHRGDFQAIC